MNNDKCVWKFQDNKVFISYCNKLKSYNKPKTDTNLSYCPFCGEDIVDAPNPPKR